MVRPGLAIAGVVVVALIAMAAIPVQRAATDFRLGGRAASAAADPKASFRETGWWELVPKDWDPYGQVRQMRRDIRNLSDTDPRAVALLKQMRDVWDNAPTNPQLDGAAVRIPGYVVPLDESKRGVREFLLVPYFGACIHTPPPPSNQIIHVTLRQPVGGVHSMDAVWVHGTLHAQRSDSSMGMSSYAMSAMAVEHYAASAAR
jgi:hypothetical protein